MKQTILSRFYLLLVCVVLILPASACSKLNGAQNSVSGNITTAASETGTARIKPDIPEVDYKGAEMRFLSRTVTDTVVRYYSEIASDEMNGEIMNDTVYERTDAIQEKYGVKIVNDTSDNVKNTYTASYLAGEDNWEVVVDGFSNVTSLASTGYLYDIASMKYIDLTKPWWDSNVAKSLSVGGKLYTVIGAMNTWTDSHTYAVVFNKELAADYSVDPYVLVRDNKWTLDTFKKIITDVTRDLNGDSVMDENDQYGAAGEYYNFMLHVCGSGVSVINKNSDDIPEIKPSQRLYDVVGKVFAVMNGGGYLLAEDYSSMYKDPWTDVLRKNFRAGSSMFYVGGIEQLLIFRDLETDIGLLPMMKYDESQENYAHSFSTYWSSAMYVPASNTHLDMTGVLLEAINAEGYYGTSVAYYDVVLKGKAMRDPDSCEMLDIIRSSRSIDFETAYSLAGLNGIFNDIMKKKDAGSFTSTLESSLPAAKTKLETILKVYDAVR